MDIEHKKYPKIPQFRDVAYEVKRQASFQGLDDDGEPIYSGSPILPEIEFTGTVKIHGTNAAIQFLSDGEVVFQSRNRIITPSDDNLGFAVWANSRVDAIRWALIDADLPHEGVTVYGEFCGKGIQAGVAVSDLDKSFIIFGVKKGNDWLRINDLESDSDLNLYGVRSFPIYSVVIDFERPEKAINEIYELTQRVEAECPVGKALGVSGIGEGVVWTSDFNGSTLRFKSKGQKHSKSKVKVHSPVDAEKAEAQRELAESLMTDERLKQGFEYLAEMGKPPIMQSLGDYLKYVVTDCIAEEGIAIEQSGVERKHIGKALSSVAKRHYINKAA